MTTKPKCAGPVYFADQGIEVCETCGGCICCDHDDKDHAGARYYCWTDGDGECALEGNEHFPGHDCEQDRTPTTDEQGAP